MTDQDWKDTNTVLNHVTTQRAVCGFHHKVGEWKKCYRSNENSGCVCVCVCVCVRARARACVCVFVRARARLRAYCMVMCVIDML
jgi:hypothetical protein